MGGHNPDVNQGHFRFCDLQTLIEWERRPTIPVMSLVFGRVSLLLSGLGAEAMNILRPRRLRSLVLPVNRIVKAHFGASAFTQGEGRDMIFGLVSFLLPFSLGV